MKKAKRTNPTRRKRSTEERALAKRLLQQLRTGGDVRQRKIRRIKAAIKVHRYESAMKLGIALDKLTA